MTSIALLTHPASHTVLSGGSTFIATAALLIPVLLLAVTIQGRTYEQMRALNVQAYDAWMITAFVVFVGCLGEGIAVIALYKGTASHATALAILIITIFLIVAILAAALLAFLASDGNSEPAAGEQEAFAAPELHGLPIAEKPGTAPGEPGPT